jgi:acyl-CoA thioesterase FadM
MESVDAFLSAFRLRVFHEVEFREIDVLKHVNNVRYCEWAEHIRCKYFADAIGEDITGATGAILAKHEMHYLNMVRYRENVIIGGRVSRWGGKSFDFQTEVWSQDRSHCVFRSTAVLVAFNYVAETTIAIPESWRERVRAFDLAGPVGGTPPARTEGG